MNKVNISDKQGIILVAMFVMGSTLIMGTGGEAKQDMWLAIILSIAAAAPFLLIYSNILASYPGKDLFDILSIVFGRIVGKLISLLMIWFSFHLGSLVLRNYGEFIKTAALPETPMLVSMFFIIVLVVWGVKLGMEVLGKWSEFFIFILLGFILFIAALSIPFMEPDNLLPIMYEGYKPILKGAFAAFTFPFAETVVFIMIFSCLHSKKSPQKVFFYGVFLGGLVIIYATMRNIMVLGSDTVYNVYFPAYSAVSRINIGNFLQRFEILVAAVFTIAGYIKISMCLMAAVIGITKLFDLKDYNFIVTPIGILMVYLSYSIYNNIMEMSEWAFKIWPYYAVPFQIVLPVIVYIGIKIKKSYVNK